MSHAVTRVRASLRQKLVQVESMIRKDRLGRSGLGGAALMMVPHAIVGGVIVAQFGPFFTSGPCR